MRVLIWLRLVDSHDRRLSLSAIALVAALALLCVHESAVSLGAFTVAALVYAHRRILVHRGKEQADRLNALAIDLRTEGIKRQDLEDRTRKLEVRLSVENNRGR